MAKLQFDSLMSGVRVTMVNEEEKSEIGEIAWITNYKDVPEIIRKQYWWSLSEVPLEFKGWEETTSRHFLNTEQVLTDFPLSQKVKDNAYIRVSSDDQHTIWVYMNRKDLWAELVEYFGSEDSVFSNYIRWFH